MWLFSSNHAFLFKWVGATLINEWNDENMQIYSGVIASKAAAQQIQPNGQEIG